MPRRLKINWQEINSTEYYLQQTDRALRYIGAAPGLFWISRSNQHYLYITNASDCVLQLKSKGCHLAGNYSLELKPRSTIVLCKGDCGWTLY